MHASGTSFQLELDWCASAPHRPRKDQLESRAVLGSKANRLLSSNRTDASTRMEHFRRQEKVPKDEGSVGYNSLGCNERAPRKALGGI